jgi:rod shape-determining protein MreD
MIIIFYFLALLQASFLPQLNIAGVTPNFVFILFFILIFFSDKKDASVNYENFFLGIICGFFLSVFSKSFFGAEIVVLVFISFFVKKIQQQLVEKNKKYPLTYFAPLFIISFVIFELFSWLVFYFYNHISPANFSWLFLAEIIYNLLFAIAGFYIFKKFFVIK